jgi:hypothetical protein
MEAHDRLPLPLLPRLAHRHSEGSELHMMTKPITCQVCLVQVASLPVPFRDSELLVCYACAEDILHKLAPQYRSDDVVYHRETARAA